MQPEAGQTERELAGAVRDWAAGLAPRIPEAEQEGCLPADVIRDLGQLGVLGMSVPESDGGLGASTVVFGRVVWVAVKPEVTRDDRVAIEIEAGSVPVGEEVVELEVRRAELLDVARDHEVGDRLRIHPRRRARGEAGDHQ